MAIKILKDLEWFEDVNGIVYTITYQIHEEDYNTYKNKYTRNSSADAWTLGSGTYIADSSFKRKAQHWMISLKAYSKGYEAGSIVTSGSTVPIPLRSYDVVPIDLPFTYWGIRKATATDVTDQIIRIQAIYDDDSATICRAGDWIYGNVTATEKTGSGIFTQCPFNKGSALADTDMPIAQYFNKKINTIQFSVVFYSRSTIEHYSAFEGVNGSFGVSATRPGDTTAKLWLANKQKVEEIVMNNSKYVKVSRSCTRAPKINGTQMYWTVPTTTWTW